MVRIKKFIPLFRPNYGKREVDAVSKVLLSGWIGLGPRTAKFEERFADYVGAKHAIALNSATAALHLALIAIDIAKRDEVIVPSLTFVSTAHVAMYVGAKPVFADVEKDTLCLSPDDVEKKITKKTRAIIPVHYGGHPVNMIALKKLAEKHNLVIIEDAAHACGSVYRNRKIGSISPFTCFSFHAVKNLATGDGGIITTNNSKVAERLRRLRWLGINKSTWGRIEKVSQPKKISYKIYGWYYEIDELGFKYHMNDINAALGLVQLGRLEASNKKRRKLAERYTKKLSNLEGIETPTVKPGMVTSQHNYAIRCDKRDELHLHLRDHGISSGVHYLPLYLHPYYQKRYRNVYLPVTEKEWQRILLLPLYPQLTAKEQNNIIKIIKKFSLAN